MGRRRAAFRGFEESGSFRTGHQRWYDLSSPVPLIRKYHKQQVENGACLRPCTLAGLGQQAHLSLTPPLPQPRLSASYSVLLPATDAGYNADAADVIHANTLAAMGALSAAYSSLCGLEEAAPAEPDAVVSLAVRKACGQNLIGSHMARLPMASFQDA